MLIRSEVVDTVFRRRGGGRGGGEGVLICCSTWSFDGWRRGGTISCTHLSTVVAVFLLLFATVPFHPRVRHPVPYDPEREEIL